MNRELFRNVKKNWSDVIIADQPFMIYFGVLKIMSALEMIDPLQKVNKKIKQRNEQTMMVGETRIKKELEETRKEEKEERRHSEHMEELRNLKVMVNNFGDNATGVQIQQGTQSSNQTLSVTQEFNYEKASEVLNEIKKYFDQYNFDSTTNDKIDEVERIVTEALELVERKENPTKIKALLNTLSALAIGATGSVIGSGIVALLGMIK